MTSEEASTENKRSEGASGKQTNSKKAGGDDSERVTNEIKRQHQRIWNTADSIDVKNGVILGFIILILVQIILTSEIAANLSANIALLWPFVASAQYLLNVITLVAFICGFVCLVYAAYVGAVNIAPRTYYDVEIEERFKDYLEHKIDGATFDRSVSRTLLNNLAENKENSQKKVEGARKTLQLFMLGIALFIVRFLVIIISIRLGQ